MHIDLAEGLSALTTTADGLYIVWWSGVPLGHVDLDRDKLPMPAEPAAELMARIVAPAVLSRLRINEKPACSGQSAIPPILEPRPLKRLRQLEGARQPLPPTSTCSVIICTHDRPEGLSQCLRSLERQRMRPLEIIVVDNAPTTEATRRLVEGHAGVRYVREPRTGLNIARNTGVQCSRGSIIAFTDDDVVLDEHWVGRLEEAFSEPHIAVVTGLVLPAELETEAQVIFEKYWGFNRGYCRKDYGPEFFRATRRRGCPVWEIGAGASMAIRRTTLHEVGTFDERLDVGAAGCNGDSELWYRVLAAGGTCRYDPDIVAFHRHRRDMVALQRQIHRYMRGFVVALLIQFECTGEVGNLRHLFLTLPAWYARLLVRGWRSGWAGRHATIKAELSGVWSGLQFYLRHRHLGRRRARPPEVLISRN
jgi:glycosyltransferase involved in cell wall biosynthesis